MTSTPVTVRNNVEQSRVEACDGDQLVGFAAYRPAEEGSLVFFHTEVDEGREGEGIGGQLAAGVVEVARAEGFTIVPECSFIRSYLRGHDDAQDVVAEGYPLRS